MKNNDCRQKAIKKMWWNIENVFIITILKNVIDLQLNQSLALNNP